MTRKCKFDKLYENVLTSYIQANGQYHKKIKNENLRQSVINKMCDNIMPALSIYMSNLILLLLHVLVLSRIMHILLELYHSLVFASPFYLLLMLLLILHFLI